ncbi:uncharacterized protein VTP21DRAFT_6602 [Calcarisporiella thermophila]|uniref:uncharacterized protein n=1 Tax=Calcarisporiella thermophila TaxID=911321 RepID=UPI0037422181
MSSKRELELWTLAVKQFDEKQYDNSIETFKSMSDKARMRFNIGIIYANKGLQHMAIRWFDSAIKLDKYLAICHYQRGVSNFLLGSYCMALEDFTKALMCFRGNTVINYNQLGMDFKLYSCEVLYNRALCLIKLDKKEEGLQVLERARSQKLKNEHNAIDEAIVAEGEGFTVFSMPMGILFRPDEEKVKDTKKVNYLDKAQVVASTDDDQSTDFSGPQKMNVDEYSADFLTSTANDDIVSQSDVMRDSAPPVLQPNIARTQSSEENVSPRSASPASSKSSTGHVEADKQLDEHHSPDIYSKKSEEPPIGDLPSPPPTATLTWENNPLKLSKESQLDGIKDESYPRKPSEDAFAQDALERSKFRRTISNRSSRAQKVMFCEEHEVHSDPSDYGRDSQPEWKGSLTSRTPWQPNGTNEPQSLPTMPSPPNESQDRELNNPPLHYMMASKTPIDMRKQSYASIGSICSVCSLHSMASHSSASSVGSYLREKLKDRIKVKCIAAVKPDIVRILLVDKSTTYDDLLKRVKAKFKCKDFPRIKYRDEENALVELSDDDDLEVARVLQSEASLNGIERLEIWVYE